MLPDIGKISTYMHPFEDYGTKNKSGQFVKTIKSISYYEPKFYGRDSTDLSNVNLLPTAEIFDYENYISRDWREWMIICQSKILFLRFFCIAVL